MRFAIIGLMSLLLLPALGSAPGNQQPQRHRSASFPPSHSRPATPPPPTHGDLVEFRGPNGPFGLIKGSNTDQMGNHDIIPLAAKYQRHGDVRVFNDRIVKAHASDISNTRYSYPRVASAIASQHEKKPPSVSGIRGPFPGSVNHDDMISRMANGGHHGA